MILWHMPCFILCIMMHLIMMLSLIISLLYKTGIPVFAFLWNILSNYILLPKSLSNHHTVLKINILTHLLTEQLIFLCCCEPHTQNM